MKRLLAVLLLVGCGSTTLVGSPGGGEGGGSSGGSGGSTGGGSAGGGSAGGAAGGSAGGGSAGGGSAGGSAGGAAGGSAGGGSAGGSAGGTGGGSVAIDAGACPHPAGAVDPTRKVVVSHPYPNDGGSRDNVYEVLDLAPSGALTLRNQFFRMGRASVADSLIAFTPDGTLGYVAQEDGTVGAFRFETNGNVTVVHSGYLMGFYASDVMMDPSGAWLWVIDFNTIGNGGGIARAAIACDGTLTALGKPITGNTPSKGAWLHGVANRAVIAATSLGASTQSAHLVDLTASASIAASAAAFPVSDAVATQVAVSGDDSLVAISDNGLFAGNRVAVLTSDGGTLTPLQVVSTSSPIGVAWSPFGRRGLVVNSDAADHYRPLVPDAGGFAVTAPLTYAFGRPELPGPPVVIQRGVLRGRVLVGELDAVRQLQFEADGGIRDVSKTAVSFTGNAQIIGTIGVAP